MGIFSATINQVAQCNETKDATISRSLHFICIYVKICPNDRKGRDMDRKEKFDLELKREITETFLKTVSAYANYCDGKIVFGIDDNGEVIGINDAEKECLRIENMINSSIDPVPDFRLSVSHTEGRDIITLTVAEGLDKPYYYKGRTYKRSDTSTLEVKRFELRRLALEGLNMG